MFARRDGVSPSIPGLPDGQTETERTRPLPRGRRLKTAAIRRQLTTPLPLNVPQTCHRLSMAYSLLRQSVSTAQIPAFVGLLGQRLDDQNRGG